MSWRGSYLRGEKWFHLNRDVDGNMTKTLLDDKDKMIDVKIYLDREAEKKEKPAVKETKSKGKK